MNNKFINKNKWISYGLVLILGLFLGWLFFRSSSKGDNLNSVEKAPQEVQIWSCSMHPQIRQDHSGKCPICGMDLIPLRTTSSSDQMLDPGAIQISKEAAALANIQTTIVERENPVKDIQLYGSIQADERLSQSQTSHVNGRIEKLFINFTGENIRRGQTIATIYSPDLLNAQQELLEAVKMRDISPELLQAAREKLRLFKLSNAQINRIEQSEKVSPLVEIHANTNGIVITKNVNQGDYINQGDILYNITDLSRIWAIFNVYETDLPFLKIGDELNYTLQALPGKTFTGKVAFIDPMLDPVTRSVKIRVETINKDLQLKPEMYANATIKTTIKTALKNNEESTQLVIPKSSILWTGKRSVVYVKDKNNEIPTFLLHEIELGPSLGDYYVVLSGIEEGDEVVTNGTFTIDASAQLEGKLSMMNLDAKDNKQSEHSEHSSDDNRHDKHNNNNKNNKHNNMKTENISVQGNCEMCKSRIEKAAKSVNGVSMANWDIKLKKLQVNFDPAKTSLDAISKIIAEAGHDTDKHKASQSVYDALPACCKYRN